MRRESLSCFCLTDFLRPTFPLKLLNGLYRRLVISVCRTYDVPHILLYQPRVCCQLSHDYISVMSQDRLLS
jgi:hypothetical protein